MSKSPITKIYCTQCNRYFLSVSHFHLHYYWGTTAEGRQIPVCRANASLRAQGWHTENRKIIMSNGIERKIEVHTVWYHQPTTAQNNTTLRKQMRTPAPEENPTEKENICTIE